jgi:PIN domain nuclease of toxin-antitoxin system
VRLLIDTHIVLAIIWRELDGRYPQWAAMIEAAPSQCAISAASLWEITIKTRMGKLELQMPLGDIEPYLTALGFPVLAVSAAHVTSRASPEPPTRDPFDRLLLAIAQGEGMRFLTADRALAGHPVTFS